MAKKKRPSLKDYLSTGQVIAEEAQEQPAPLEEAPAAPSAGEPSAPEKKPAKARKPRSSAAKKKTPVPDENTGPSTGESSSPDEESVVLEESSDELRSFVDMLCGEDRKTWEKIFAVTGAEFLPLDFVERREDFRTMDRSRFTLFRLDEAGQPLFHVRTSVQIREPLIALLKWDETGKATVYRP
jgi:hypothetical protein